MVRRLGALAIGIVILILIVLGVRGCLNARKTRSFENFVADLRSLTAQTEQLSKGFLSHLQNPPSSKLDFNTTIETDAGTASALLGRAQTLSTPGELSGAHGDLVLSYELRANALSDIAGELRGGGKSQAKADAILSNMKQLLASDIIYGRARSEIDHTLADQGIDERAPANVFLPNPQQWLRPSTISGILAGVGVAGTSGAVSGVHGTGIVSAALDGATLTAGVAATVTSAAPNTLDIGVANQGNSTEKNVRVTVKVSGGVGTKTKTIPSIAPGATQTAAIELGSPPTGSPLTIAVSVAPVLGERITTNNHATYTVTFQ
jgi:CARDB